MIIWFIRDCDGTTDNDKWPLTAGCNSHRDSGLSLLANLHFAEAVDDSSGIAMIRHIRIGNDRIPYSISYQIHAQVTTALCIYCLATTSCAYPRNYSISTQDQLLFPLLSV